LDTTPITTEIARIITAGTTEHPLLAAVARKFPDLTAAELSHATTQAEHGGEEALRSSCSSR
jgi:hypothetical protein